MKNLKKLSIVETNEYENTKPIEELLNSTKNLEELSLSIQLKNPIKFQNLIFKNLRILDVVGSVYLDEQLSMIIINSPLLEDLSIGIVNEKKDPFDPTKVLNRITNKSIQQLSKCEKLKSLKLFYCNITMDCITYLTEHKVPKENLLIYGSVRMEESFKEISTPNEHLRKLCIGKVKIKSLKNIEKYFPNLIHLEMNSYESFESDVFVSISKLKMLKKLLFRSFIQQLNFKSDLMLQLNTVGLYKLTFNQILTVIASCPCVEYLQIDKNHSSYRNDIMKLIKEQLEQVDQFKLINSFCEKKGSLPTEYLFKRIKELVETRIVSKDKHETIIHEISNVLETIGKDQNVGNYSSIVGLFYKYYYSSIMVETICNDMMNLTKKLKNFVETQIWEIQ
jgi:hypothetical protein